MKRTYNSTLFLSPEELQKATVKLFITDGVKWEVKGLDEETEVTYTGLKQWSIVDGDDATQIEADFCGKLIDEYHEYLVLEFVDGTEATFRNSHVDMFIR